MDYDIVFKKGYKYYLHFANKSDSSYHYIKLKSVIAYDIGNASIRMGTLPTSSPSSTKLDDRILDPIHDNSYRFIGSSPKNYISFNGELWRIIGVFDTEDENGNEDRRLKITRNENVESTNWDISDPDVNGGSGINEWSQSTIMKLLNPGFDNNEGPINVNNEMSSTTINNSLYWNKASGTCYAGGYGSKPCDFTSTGLSSEAKKYIDDVKWYTGALNTPYSNMTAWNVYSAERGTATGKDGITVSDYPSLDNVNRTTTWVGKVGLPSLSDYALAASDYYYNGELKYTRETCLSSTYSGNLGACVSTNDWLYWNNMPIYTMTPTNGGASSTGSRAPYLVAGLTGSNPNITTTSAPFYVKPTVYLNPKTIISGGTGTQSDPYTISMGTAKNPKANYGLDETGEEGETIVIPDDTPIFDEDDLKNQRLYSFEYDTTNNWFINENRGRESSIATAYTTIDMTNESLPRTILIKYDISSRENSDYGHINIQKDNYTMINYSSNYYDTSVLDTSGIKQGTIEYELEPGSMYYIQFGYVKKSFQEITAEIRDDFRIQVLNKDSNETSTTFNRYDGLAPVLNQEVDTVHVLRDINMADTLTIVDIQNVVLDLNGYTLTTTELKPVITNNGSLKIIDSKFDDAMSSTDLLQAQYDAEYEAALEEQNEIKSQYSINSYESDGLLLNYNSDLNDVSKSTITNQVDNSEYELHLVKYEDKTKGLVFGDNSYVITDEFNPNKLTVETTFKITEYQNQFIIGNYETGGYGIYVNASNQLVGGVCVDGAYKEIKMPDIQLNTKYTVALTYDENKVVMYVNGTKYDEIVITSSNKAITSTKKNTYVAFGTNPVSNEPFGQYMKGVIYSARIYNDALNQEQVTNNYTVDSALLQDPIVKQIAPREYDNLNGTVTSSITTTILNNDGAYLEVDSGNINNIATSGIAIDNKGTLKVNEDAFVNATSTGIVNTGSLLPSQGTVTANVGINNSKGGTTIKDFNIVTTGTGIISSYSSLQADYNTYIDNVNVDSSRTGVSLSYIRGTITDSSIKGSVALGYVNVNNSNLNGTIDVVYTSTINNSVVNSDTITTYLGSDSLTPEY